jgi:hypothetical protein
MAKSPWKPWHEVVKLRDDLRSGELPLHVFGADLYEVMMQHGRGDSGLERRTGTDEGPGPVGPMGQMDSGEDQTGGCRLQAWRYGSDPGPAGANTGGEPRRRTARRRRPAASRRRRGAKAPHSDTTARRTGNTQIPRAANAKPPSE